MAKKTKKAADFSNGFIVATRDYSNSYSGSVYSSEKELMNSILSGEVFLDSDSKVFRLGEEVKVSVTVTKVPVMKDQAVAATVTPMARKKSASSK